MKTSFISSFGVFVRAILLKVFHVYNIFAVFPLTLGFSRFVIILSIKRDSISFLCANSFAFRAFFCIITYQLIPLMIIVSIVYSFQYLAEKPLVFL